jgi:folate-binding protein YgfZ
MNSELMQHNCDLARKARETGLFAVLGKDGPASGLADLGAIAVSGADARSFLHSQLTNEVKALKPGEGNLSARVTRTGTLVRYFSLHNLPVSNAGSGDQFLLLLERDGIAPLLADLGKYAVVEDVVLEDVSAKYDFLAIQGPAAAAVMLEVFGNLEGDRWNDLSENAVRAVCSGNQTGYACSRSLTGETGFVIALAPASTAATTVVPADVLAKHKLITLKGNDLAAVLEILRVEAGIVRVGPDAPEAKFVLPETGLEQQVVSYSKGCYLGQEVIARIRTYGSVPHALRGLVFENAGNTSAQWSALLDRLPPLGADVVLENGTKIGSFASRSLSPVLEAPIAFAYLDRNHRTPGTTLSLRGADGAVLQARIQLLPFYKASDTQSRVAFLHDRAIRMFADGHDDKAIELLTEALRLDPSFSDGYEALGVILGRTGKFHEAIDIFKRLEEVAPNEPMVHTNLSLYYMKLGDKTAAEDEKAKATVKQFSRFGELRQREAQAAAVAEQARADAQRRKAMFEEVLEIDPEDPIALFGLGNAFAALSEWENAERALARASAAQKDNSAIYAAHGKALEMLSREADALKVYRDGMAVASRKGDLMPLKEMERRVLLLSASTK